MSKVIPFSELSRQHKLHLLDHRRKEYQEREAYLQRLRRLLFQVEGQMRQAEIEQLELYFQLLKEFQIEIQLPDLGDRVGLQRLFQEHPALLILREFLEGNLSPESCYDRLSHLIPEKGSASPE